MPPNGCAGKKGWHAGVLTRDAIIPKDWKPRRPTLILIDEAGRFGAKLGPVLNHLRRAATPGHPIRVLVVDQIHPNPDSDDAKDRAALKKAAFPDLALGGLAPQHVCALAEAEGGDPAVVLAGCDGRPRAAAVRQ